ncbi:MAG: PLP-dependent aminotransferase family protein, partial [Pseudomonadota bacterium]
GLRNLRVAMRCGCSDEVAYACRNRSALCRDHEPSGKQRVLSARGTYVLDRRESRSEFANPPSIADYPADTTPHQAIPGRTNLLSSSATDVNQSTEISRMSVETARRFPQSMIDYVREIPADWGAAGSQWLSTANWKPEIESIVPTNGALAGVIAIIAAMTRPGDRIAFEGLSYASAARSAALLGRRITTVDFDENGILPESLEKVCAQQHPKMLYLMSDIQNPTTATLPLDRRKAIADIANKYNLLILDDAIYASLAEAKLPTFNELAPELSYRVSGLSKSVSVSPHSGWIACPPRYTDRIHKTHKMTTGGDSFWMNQLAAELILSGKAEQIESLIKAENNKRLNIARSILPEDTFRYQRNCAYIWFKLPEPWLSGTFKNAAAAQDIDLSSEDDFKVTRLDQTFHAIRLGLGNVTTHEELTLALKTLRNILDSGIAGYDRHE